MESKVSGGTFVSWRGHDGERIPFIRISVPIDNYDAEPWGGILLIANQPDYRDVEVLEIENLREEVNKLTARIGNRQVYWKPERNQQNREAIKKKLGRAPLYIG